jgi:predicted dehydrogenase
LSGALFEFPPNFDVKTNSIQNLTTMNDQRIITSPMAVNRRGFLKVTSAAVAGTAMLGSAPFVLTSRAAADDPIKIGIIGCGGRGVDAARNAVASSPNVKVVAVADVFENQAKGAANAFKVDADHTFWGFDAYKKVVAIPDVTYVILATPPGFRPVHFEAAVNAGKHVFSEKPVATDAAGIRKFIAAGELAKQKKLNVVAGTQRRHQAIYIDTIKKIHDGALGEILCLRAYWNGGAIWHRGDVGATEMEKQVHNWYHYLWLCGDHICEQHVHNLDVCNWIMGAHPVKAHGMGGRQSLGNLSGSKWDHFAIEYEYANGVRMFSQCRQIKDTENNVSEAAVGTKGRLDNVGGGLQYSGPQPNPYEIEHADLIAAIRGTAPYINEAKTVAESTLTAIMGRESAYMGRTTTWDEAMNWKTSLVPENLAWDAPAPKSEVPIPGIYDIN